MIPVYEWTNGYLWYIRFYRIWHLLHFYGLVFTCTYYTLYIDYIDQKRWKTAEQHWGLKWLNKLIGKARRRHRLRGLTPTLTMLAPIYTKCQVLSYNCQFNLGRPCFFPLGIVVDEDFQISISIHKRPIRLPPFPWVLCHSFSQGRVFQKESQQGTPGRVEFVRLRAGGAALRPADKAPWWLL